MADIDYSQVDKDITTLTRQDPTLSVSEARSQAISNQRLNKNLSSYFGVNQGSQLQNFKFDSATLKNQFGSIGEEASVAISKSTSSGNADKVPFPFDESMITVPDVVANTSQAGANALGSIANGFETNGLGFNDLSTTVGGMFNSVGTQFSSVVAGVGSGITSAFNNVKSTISSLAKNIPSTASTANGKAAYAANPFASADQQVTAFKSYLAQESGSTNPFFDQLKSKFGELTSADVGGRLPSLSTLGDKSIVTTSPGSAIAGTATVIKSILPDLSGIPTQTANSVLDAKPLRAQLFPADALEQKFQSLGNALTPQIKQYGQGIVDGLNVPGISPGASSNVPINQDQVTKDIAILQKQDPTLTEAEARDQATRNQQFNQGLTNALGFGNLNTGNTGIKI